MTDLDRFRGLDACKRVVEAIGHRGRHRAVGGLWGSSAALFLAALQKACGRSLLVVTADDGDGELLRADLSTFGADSLQLPERALDIDGQPEPNAEGSRARTLSQVGEARRDERAFLLCASLHGLLQPAPSVDTLDAGLRLFEVGQRLPQSDLVAAAVDAGLRRVPVVLAPGEVSERGDVIDIYPLAATEAVRFEMFDDEIESIRVFDPGSQRSLGARESIALQLGGSSSSASGSQEDHVLTHVFSDRLIVCWYEPLRIDERRQQLITLGEASLRNRLVQLQETLVPLNWLEVSSLPSQDLDFKILSAGSAVGAGEADPLGRLRVIRGLAGDVVEIVCGTEPERDRLAEVFEKKDVDLEKERVRITVGSLSRGFRIPDLHWTVLSNTEFVGVPPRAKTRERPKVPSRALQSFFELGPGDLVVHAVHGIAVFEGIERVERGEAIEDHLRLIFRDDVRLLVPVSKIHLVQKYVGSGEARPKLDKLGGKGFQKRKQEVQASMFDLASDLLEVQAKREKFERAPFAKDPLEDDFLATFPFEDTEDQQICWDEIRTDLEKTRPMDRLLCGDVGFGKTELAMRAAFKVAITGRQVALLVPTTVLADQHGRNFRQRFEPLGLRVEVLSRFVTAKNKKKITEDAKAGRVDVLIGTHRLLSQDVGFLDLGIVIVDEEQRFGVRQKEKLKQLRAGVDVLALSATPIPRTLHASLLGIRAISMLTTPPPGRQDVETRVAYREDGLLRDALQRELARGGQAYVLHDRISGLPALVETIEGLVPNAKVGVGHGKLTETQLDKTLRAFVGGELDILVCTSIVENGLDISRANTIVIDRADLFGLAELHQLRGRVGRSDVKAYCYVLMDRLNPPAEPARKRLKALEEFSNLGAGFAIAMKDLEIRGAGNLLGPQQSGHVAAVGYDMYCQLLAAAVEQAQSNRDGTLELPPVHEVDVDLQVAAFLPDTFVADAKTRLEILREMDDAHSPERAAAVRDDLADRYGHLPEPVEVLLRVFLLKHLLEPHGVLGIQRTGPDRLVVRHRPEQPLGGSWLSAFADVRNVEAGKTHLLLPPPRGRKQAAATGVQTLQLLLDSLSGDDQLPKIGSWASSDSGGRRKRGSRRRSASPS